MKNKSIEVALDKLNALKKRLPEYNAFGDNNHAIINAQLDMIENYEELDVLVDHYELTDMQESDLYTTQEWLNGEITDEEFFETLD